MTTDITELTQSKSLRKKLNRRLNDAYGFQRTSGGKHTTISLSIDECKSIIAAMDERLALVEALEKAQTINAAAEKLVRCKGRYHSEQNYRALAALFGVNTPDLPPLDDESHAVTVENLQESAYRAGLTAGWNLGLANNNEGFNKCLAAHTAGIKVEVEVE
ncbi:hypothetical protein WJA10_001856 [Klebsiella pneumoniae]|uniref:hypothetical protein n=1 Tax=Klebsiella pneumoniae TaxID=573 RepID=UPI0035CCFF8C